MSRIRAMGRNGAVMELEGLFAKGERLALGGKDFMSNSVGEVSAVLSQSGGYSKIQIEFVRGGLSEEARYRIADEIRETRTRARAREAEFGLDSDRGERYSDRARARARQADQDGAYENQEDFMFGSDVDPNEVAVSDPNTPRIMKEIALDVEIPMEPTETRVPMGGFGELIRFGIDTLKGGGLPGGLKANADRSGIIDRPLGYMSQEDHVEAINAQAAAGFGDTWDGEPLMTVTPDRRVGMRGGYGRSDYADEYDGHQHGDLIILPQNEAVAEAVEAMRADGINPRSVVRGLDKYGRRGHQGRRGPVGAVGRNRKGYRSRG